MKSNFTMTTSLQYLNKELNRTCAYLSWESNEVPKCNGMQVSQLIYMTTIGDLISAGFIPTFYSYSLVCLFSFKDCAGL